MTTFNNLRAALSDALAPLTAFRQFVVYRLVDNGDGTLDKVPVNPLTLHNSSALDATNWLDASTAISVAEQHNTRVGWAAYGVGFALTHNTGLWCVDVDSCIDAQGQLSALAREAYDYFAGAAVEISVSGRGIHIWGSGEVPAHANKYGDQRGKLELYTSHRFIALSGAYAHGYAGNDFTEQISAYAAHYFAPKAEDTVALADGPCAEWAGPRDDGELIAAALMAEPAQIAPDDPSIVLDVNFGDLWTRNVEVLRRQYAPNKEGQPFDASDADNALARKLAYWTGRDVARTERLMHMSGLAREKWQRRRGWITETIVRSARSVKTVYGADNTLAHLSPEQRDFYMQRAVEFVHCLQRKKEERAHERFQLKSCDELLHAAPLKWLVRGVLPQEGIAAMYGPSGSGKSFLAIDVAIAAASENITEWFGHKTATVPVTYMALEGARGVGKRLKAWQLTNGPLPTRLKFVDADFSMAAKSPDVVDLATVLQKNGMVGGLVVIDTLARAAAGADENSGAEMGAIIANAAKLQQLVGGLVLVVHHTRKSTGTTGIDELRGHSSLYAALDAAISVQRGKGIDGEPDVRTWAVAKSKDDADGRTVPFDLRVLTVGEDEDGPITSCVVKHGEQTARPATKAKQKTKEERPREPAGKNQKFGWEVFMSLIKRAPNNMAHPDFPCVGALALEQAIDKGLQECGVEHRRIPVRRQEAITGLRAARFIVSHGELPNLYYYTESLKHSAESHQTPLTG